MYVFFFFVFFFVLFFFLAGGGGCLFFFFFFVIHLYPDECILLSCPSVCPSVHPLRNSVIQMCMVSSSRPTFSGKSILQYFVHTLLAVIDNCPS